MTQAQIKAAIAQADKIIAAMDADTLASFRTLSAHQQFLLICAGLSATADFAA